MSHNYRSAEARELNQERRTADRTMTLERHAGRSAKVSTRVAFGGAR